MWGEEIFELDTVFRERTFIGLIFSAIFIL